MKIRSDIVDETPDADVSESKQFFIKRIEDMIGKLTIKESNVSLTFSKFNQKSFNPKMWRKHGFNFKLVTKNL